MDDFLLIVDGECDFAEQSFSIKERNLSQFVLELRATVFAWAAIFEQNILPVFQCLISFVQLTMELCA